MDGQTNPVEEARRSKASGGFNQKPGFGHVERDAGIVIVGAREDDLNRFRSCPIYVLVTPARNEARFIESTIKSVAAQTVKPIKWIIVSDGSTDGTDEIVRKYAADYSWIELVRMPERRERHFAGKAHAFNAGHARVADLEFSVIGNLDADVSFEADHFEFLVSKFADDARLGVVGSPFQEGTYHYDYRFSNIENVWGGCQLFRRACMDDIGGYVPVKGGCVDHIAVVSARMKGWKTKTFVEKVCLHHRVMGTAEHSELAAKFRAGVKDYSVGNHPVWELFRMFYQMKYRPFVGGGLALGSGYAWSLVRRVKRPVSGDLVAFTRREQMHRLRRFLARMGSSGRP
jgi:biofilm PGA synthesis N-glycosyltransferase PgaC